MHHEEKINLYTEQIWKDKMETGQLILDMRESFFSVTSDETSSTVNDTTLSGKRSEWDESSSSSSRASKKQKKSRSPDFTSVCDSTNNNMTPKQAIPTLSSFILETTNH